MLGMDTDNSEVDPWKTAKFTSWMPLALLARYPSFLDTRNTRFFVAGLIRGEPCNASVTQEGETPGS